LLRVVVREYKKVSIDVLTIFFGFVFIDLISYISKKYSDFSENGFLKIFSDSAIMKL